MSGSSMHMAEEIFDSQEAWQHEQELDQQKLRNLELKKLLGIYIKSTVPHLLEALCITDQPSIEALHGVMESTAQLAIIDEEFNSINL